MALHSWPDLGEADSWVIEAIEEQIAGSTRAPAEMRAYAAELRERAAEMGPFSGRDALLAVAERYEEAAARQHVS